MSNKALEFVKSYNEKQGYGTTDRELYEVLTESKEVYREESGSHRWWNDYFIVVSLDGQLIGFIGADATGDTSLSDLGWEFNPNSVTEVEAKEKVITVYEVKKGAQ
jgi:GGDEF domain-containing protein